jgi:ketosteroid isomerase-like protein
MTHDATGTDDVHLDHIRSLEVVRCLALQTRDITRLSALLHPEFEYVHASGRTEDRTDYLNSIADTATTYGDFLHHEVEVKHLGAGALMGGVLCHSKTAGGRSRSLKFRFTAAWATCGPGDWRLLRWHNTKIVPMPSPGEPDGATERAESR